MRTNTQTIGHWLLLLSISAATPAAFGAAADVLTFHRDAQRTGWYSSTTQLAPADVGSTGFGAIWESATLDPLDDEPAHLYASPLYVDRVQLSSGPRSGKAFSVVFAASHAGYVYAINAAANGATTPGTILWRTHLNTPCKRNLDGNRLGVLSTPVIDAARRRMYVSSCIDRSPTAQSWAIYALDITNGSILAGWPVLLDRAALNAPAMNRNAPPTSANYVPPPSQPPYYDDLASQRAALNLSPDGTSLYVAFGESLPGWMAAVSTTKAKLSASFATIATPTGTFGGVWGVGGAAVDSHGDVFLVTGSDFNSHVEQPHDWVQSALKLSGADGARRLALLGTYTPFNYCVAAKMDIDLGSGGVLLVPDLDRASTSTPQLMAFGGKQGNVYLLNRAQLPGRLDRRQACSTDPASDTSLLPPATAASTRAPLNVFGPYSDTFGAMDQAKSRSLPAYFRGADGAHYLFASGSSKRTVDSPESVPPGLARLRIVTQADRPAHLAVEQLERTVTFQNPGSPVVTSKQARDAVVWVLDMNARRTASLAGANAPRPVLYAFDALSLKLLWRSRPDELRPGGRYAEPVFARGTVIVGTDRIQAFGLRTNPSAPPASSGVTP